MDIRKFSEQTKRLTKQGVFQRTQFRILQILNEYMPIGVLFKTAPYTTTEYFINTYFQAAHGKYLNRLYYNESVNIITNTLFLLRTKENQFLFKNKIVYLYPNIFNDPHYQTPILETNNYLMYVKDFVDDWVRVD